MSDQFFTISLFDNVGDSVPKAVLCTWGGFCKALASPKVRANKDGQLFSPARYAVMRRLQSNVIDLSMLVLEVDGAWKCDCCGVAGPHVLFVSNRIKDDSGRVDRSPRCPSCLKAKCEKCFEKKPKPHTVTTITPLEISLESIIEACRRVFWSAEFGVRSSEPQAMHGVAGEYGANASELRAPNSETSSAFALYSTHSNQRVTATKCGVDGICGKCAASAGWPNRTVGIEDAATDESIQTCGSVYGHEHAERCMRVVAPLASPISRDDFPSLWTWAVNQLNEQGIPADPQSKDQNRIFYTPVKFSEDSPYEWHVEPGEFFNWQSALFEKSTVSSNAVDSKQSAEVKTRAAGTQSPTQSSSRAGYPAPTIPHPLGVGAGSRVAEADSGFANFEELHAELCRRIEARGKQNTRGSIDAKCSAHNGRGETSLFLNPHTLSVSCNAGCDYWEIVRAEGLPDVRLKSSVTLQRAHKLWDSRQAYAPRMAPLTALDLHCVYAVLLAHLCELTSEHEVLIAKHWGQSPYGEELVPYPGAAPDSIGRTDQRIKIASVPNSVQRVQAANQLAEWFDLREVPGFYIELQTSGPAAPTRESEIVHWQSRYFGQWRLHLPVKSGLLVPRFDERGNVYAIQIYRSVKDTRPLLLTSRGLPAGAKAIAVREERAVA